MGRVRDDVLEEVESHSETITLEDFVRLVEEHHPDERPGIAPETLADYIEAAFFDVDVDALEERLTDSEEWVPGDRIYEVGDGRVSVYPNNWHETFQGLDDIRDLVEMIQSEVTEPEGSMYESVTERGVPEEKILRIAKVTEGFDRETTRERLAELRQNGEIEEYASQSRTPTVKVE